MNRLISRGLNSLIRGPVWLASAVAWPFYRPSLAKTATCIAAWWILQPIGAATMLFPRAEKVLQEEGLRPGIAQELAPGKRVYVRTDNLAGKAHALFDTGVIGTAVRTYRHIRLEIPVTVNVVTHPDAWVRSPDVCAVALPEAAGKEELRQMRVALMNIAGEDARYQPPVSEKDMRRKILLREIRRCSDENRELLGHSREGDADYRAITTLAREEENPALREAFVQYANAAGFTVPPGRDTALYLDFKFRHEAMPTASMLERANTSTITPQAMVVIGEFARAFNVCSNPDNKKDCDYDYKASRKQLSALELRRLELTEEGIRSFVIAHRIPAPRKVTR